MRDICVFSLPLLTVMALMVIVVETSQPESQESCDLLAILENVDLNQACIDSSFMQLTSLLKELREVNQAVLQTLERVEKQRPRHCQDLLLAGDSGRGVRQVYPFPGQHHNAVRVYCDHTVDGGGWTVIQHRVNATVREDFNRTWVEYQLGFGDLEEEFWLGLNLLHILTSSALQELRIDLADYEGQQRWAKYGMFYVGPPQDNYRLSVGRYTGDAGDGLAAKFHHGMQFSTHDADHDTDSGGNCGTRFGAGWWYGDCFHCNLNGLPYEGFQTQHSEVISWFPWRGYHYSLRTTSMSIRPAF